MTSLELSLVLPFSLTAYDSTGARCGRSRPRVIATRRRCLGEREWFECASVPPFSCQARGLLCPPRGTCEMTGQAPKKQKQTLGESSSPPPVEEAPPGVGQTGRSPEPDNKYAKRRRGGDWRARILTIARGMRTAGHRFVGASALWERARKAAKRWFTESRAKADARRDEALRRLGVDML